MAEQKTKIKSNTKPKAAPKTVLKTEPESEPESKPQIELQFTRFVYAFSYDEKSPFDGNACAEIDGKAVKVFDRTSFKPENLRRGLDELLRKDGGASKIADCYELRDECRKAFFLPVCNDANLKFYSRYGDEYELSIPKIQLFLFESGVGFVSMEAIYEIDHKDDINEYYSCNYYISEIKGRGNHFEVTYDNGEQIPFTTADLLAKIIDLVPNAQLLQQDGAEQVEKAEGNSLSNSVFYTGNRGVIFSYLLLDKQPTDDTLHNLLYLSRKNYVGSYKPPKIYSSLKDDPYVKRIYENMFWSCSYNAAVNISYLVGDKKADDHSRGTTANGKGLPQKLRNTYFFLFINALHQRCAMMKYISEMGTLDELDMDYDTMKRELKECNALHSAALNLKFRDFFLVPSTIENINIYYDLLLSSFCVNTLYKSFIDDINMLKSLCDSYVTRINERDKKIRQKRKIKVGIFVSLFGSLVALASLINSYWSVLEKAFGKSVSIWSAPVIIAICLIIAPIITIIWDTVEQGREMRKITKELADERADNLVESDKQRKANKKQTARENRLQRKALHKK